MQFTDANIPAVLYAHLAKKSVLGSVNTASVTKSVGNHVIHAR